MPSMLACAILELLARQPSSGYDLKKRFTSSLAFGWHAHDSQIYPALRRLEQAGLVDAREESGGGGPPRRVYALTDAGSDTLLDWLRSPLDDSHQKSELILRVWAADLVPSERMRELLSEVEEQARQQILDMVAIRNRLQERYGPPEVATDSRQVGVLLCLDHDIQLLRAKLAWVERAQNVIQTRAAFEKSGARSPEPAA
ncbi:MAG: helix-turn-helix transcriptional regulator [Chloroflexota bacterium]